MILWRREVSTGRTLNRTIMRSFGRWRYRIHVICCISYLKYEIISLIIGTEEWRWNDTVFFWLQAKYKTSKHVKSDPKLTLFVGRLNPSTSEEKLREVSSCSTQTYGNVLSKQHYCKVAEQLFNQLSCPSTETTAPGGATSEGWNVWIRRTQVLLGSWGLAWAATTL